MPSSICPPGAVLSVVGPNRPLSRPATFLREDPIDGGPAAALITGLLWALATGAEAIATLPGDAPAGGRAAAALLAELGRQDRDAVVGVDASGRDQVLQLALRPAAARRLIELAGPDRGHDQSVRRLVTALSPGRLVLLRRRVPRHRHRGAAEAFSQPPPHVIRRRFLVWQGKTLRRGPAPE